MHKDIGKKVRCGKLTGTLMAVDCDDTSMPHIIQLDEGEGWTLTKSDNDEEYQSAREQGVKDGTPNLDWVGSYELIEQTMRTIDDCKAGDVLVDGEGDYKVVHERLGKIIFAGFYNSNLEVAINDVDCGIYTIENMKKNGFSIYTPSKRTADDVLSTLSEEDKAILKGAMK